MFPEKIEFDDKEYMVNQLTETARFMYTMMLFVDVRIGENRSQFALFQTAKKSYLDSLKHEILLNKSGLLFQDN